MIRTYYLAKIIKKLNISSFYKCEFDKTARVSVRCSLYKVQMGRYSYVGEGSRITDTIIGNFCSIGGNCGIGGGMHPMYHVSTSPVFLEGRNILNKHFAEFPYDPSKTVHIGNDVWIGDGVYIRSGITIGDGAIVGAHAVVIHDVAPYTIVAGVPAREIRKRFSEAMIEKLQGIKWWDWPNNKLQEFAQLFDNPELFIKENKK